MLWGKSVKDCSIVAARLATRKRRSPLAAAGACRASRGSELAAVAADHRRAFCRAWATLLAATIAALLLASGCVDEQRALARFKAADSASAAAVDSLGAGDLDADIDAEVEVDGEADAGTDAVVDAEVDAGADGFVDAEVDAGADEIVDAEVDAGTDALVDADADAGADAGSEIDADAADADSSLDAEVAVDLCAGLTACDDGNGCTSDSCDKTQGCVYLANSLTCTDGDACTVGDACKASACSPGGTLKCDDANPCTSDSCDKTQGCVYLANSLTCTDGDACTVGDACKAGACSPGGTLKCDDGNGCTSDSCDKTQGCVYLANSLTCTDGDACTEGDKCVAKACSPGLSKACDDGNGCTSDSCDKTEGCVYSANSFGCDDGDACSVGDACKASACSPGGTLKCDDGNPCTSDSCDKTQGCVYLANSLTCTDGDACTEGDKCVAKACSPGLSKACDDGNPCTGDSCDKAKGCVAPPAQDGSTCGPAGPCVTASTCKAGACAVGKSTLFSTTLGGSKSEAVSTVIALPWGGFAVAGSTASAAGLDQDAWVTGIDAAGAPTFQATFGGAKDDAVTAAVAWADGIALAGATYSKAGTENDFYLVRTDKAGNKLWEQTYGGSGEEWALDITADAGGYTLAGPSNTASKTNYDAQVVRVDTAGKLLWSKTYGGAAGDQARALVAVPGGHVVAGLTASTGAGSTDAWVFAVDTSGTLLWAKTIGGAQADTAEAIAAAGDGVIVAGRLGGAGGSDALLARLDSKGNLLWQSTVGVAADDFAFGVAAVPGGYAVAGLAGGPVVGSKYQYRIARTNGTGGLIHALEWPADSDSADLGFAALPNGFALAGRTLVSGKSDYDAKVLVTDTWGHIACVDAGGCATKTGADCDDGNPCTTDTCDAAKGCSAKAMADGTSCGTNLVCQTGVCSPTCIAGQPCDDKDACTSADKCAAGACTGTAVVCSDANPCTADSCDKTKGCVALPNSATCTDGSACTVGDVCAAGACKPGSAAQCDDGSACTADSCDAKSGCGNAVKDCNDGNSCTVDSCDKLKGCVKLPVIDGIACGGSATCQAGICTGSGKCTDADLWQKSFGGTQTYDSGNAIADAGDGGYLVAGSVGDKGAGEDDFWLIRLDGAGKLLWDAAIGTKASDFAEDVTRTADGGFVAVGRTGGGGLGGLDGYAAKVGSDGKVAWTKVFGGVGHDALHGVTALPDGGVLVVGATAPTLGGTSDGWLLKLSPLGAVVWEHKLGGPAADELFAVAVMADGGLLAAGKTTSSGAGLSDGWVVRRKADGASLWDYPIGGTKDDKFSGLVGFWDGSAVLVGATQSSGAGADDGWAVKLDKDGAQFWAKTYGTAQGDSLAKVAAIGTEHVVAAGHSVAAAGAPAKTWVATVDGSGVSQWQKTYGGVEAEYGAGLMIGASGVLAMVATADTQGGDASEARVWRVDPFGNATCGESGGCLGLGWDGCSDGNPCTAEGCGQASGCEWAATSGSTCPTDDTCSADGICTGGICNSSPLLWKDKPYDAADGGTWVGQYGIMDCNNKLGWRAKTKNEALTLHSPGGSVVWSISVQNSTSIGNVRGCAISPNREVYAVGGLLGNTGTDVYLLAYSPTGQQAWKAPLGWKTTFTEAQNVTARLGATNSAVFAWGPNGSLQAFSLTGVKLWTQSTPGGLNKNSQVLAVDEGKAVILYGEKWIGKYSANGNEIWSKSLSKMECGYHPDLNAWCHIRGASASDSGEFAGLLVAHSDDGLSNYRFIQIDTDGKLTGSFFGAGNGKANVNSFSINSAWPRGDGRWLILYDSYSASVDKWGNAECGKANCGKSAWSDCDDSNGCTNDTCDPTVGCSHLPAKYACADDGLLCTDDVCANGKCTHSFNTKDCPDDGLVCTYDICASGSCVHKFNSAPCTDNNPCTTPDTCANGACKGASSPAPTCALSQIPSKTATQGCDTLQTCAADESPAHPVTLPAYNLDQNEVSNAQYAACVTANKCTSPQTGGSCLYGKIGKETNPVTCLTWQQAADYCKWAYTDGRLPTEAEYERAARSTDDRNYPWGNAEPDCSYAGFNPGPSCGSVKPVGSFPAGKSADGLYDLAGNVREWTADWYAADYYKTAPALNPTGPTAGTDRVIRGGGYLSSAASLRATARDHATPDTTAPDLGFRCARSGN